MRVGLSFGLVCRKKKSGFFFFANSASVLIVCKFCDFAPPAPQLRPDRKGERREVCRKPRELEERERENLSNLSPPPSRKGDNENPSLKKKKKGRRRLERTKSVKMSSSYRFYSPSSSSPTSSSSSGYNSSPSSSISSSAEESPGSPSEAEQLMIFGSLQVDLNSPTPYTDATQVRKMLVSVTTTKKIHNFIFCCC